MIQKLFIVAFLLLIFVSVIIPQERLIKPGDSIDIVVYGHQELSRVVTVGPDGSVNFPFMQNIPVDGMTLDELRRFMVAQLSKYLEGKPIITVSFSEGQLIRVSVLGYVQKPGTVRLPLSATLQEAISEAGGPLQGAKMEQVTLIREDNGTRKKENYNLVYLNLLGDMRQNPQLKNEDIVLVTGNPIFSGVKVIGEVNSPGIYESFYGANILDIIFKAGGFTGDAKLTEIRYVSPSQKRSREITIDIEQYYKNPQYYDLPIVQAGDIIIVPEKLKVWRNILSTIGSLSSIFSMVYLIVRIQELQK